MELFKKKGIFTKHCSLDLFVLVPSIEVGKGEQGKKMKIFLNKVGGGGEDAKETGG